MDQLNGVDFDKGCYVGQEVVSRMEHRGTARKRIVPVRDDGAAAEPARRDRPATSASARWARPAARGLAMLRLDRVEDALARRTPLDRRRRPLRLVQAGLGAFCCSREAAAQ